MRDLIFMLCWVILFPAAFLSAHIGVLLWIWIAISTPNLLLYNFLSGFPFNKMIAAITALTIIVKPDKKDFYIDLIIVLLTIFGIISAVSNFLTLSSAQYVEDVFEKILKEYVLFIIITGVMFTRHRIHVAVLAFCISLAFLGAFEGAAYILSGTGHKVLGSSSLGDNNGVAVALLMTTPLCFYFVIYSEDKIARLGFSLLIFFNLVAIVATFSRGGFLGLLVLAIFMIMNARNKVAPIFIIIASFVLISLFAPAEWYDRMGSISEAGSNGSFLGRVVSWKVAIVSAMDNPFFGNGAHALQDSTVWNKYVNNISSLTFISTPDIPPFPLAAHSIFFEVLGDAGFSGLLCFVGILFLSIFYCGAIVKRCKNRPDLLWANDLARLLRVSVIVYIAAGSALSFAYFEGFWIVVAIISRLNHTTRQLTRSQPEAAEAAVPV